MHQTLTLSPLTNIAILVMAIGQLLLVGAVVYLAFRLKAIVSETVKQTLDSTLPRIQPVIDNATRVTGQVSDLVESVAPRVRNIAEDTETTVHGVAAKVKTTSTIVTEGVAKPLANVAAVLTGFQRALTVWRTAKTQQDGAAAKADCDKAQPTPGAQP